MPDQEEVVDAVRAIQCAEEGCRTMTYADTEEKCPKHREQGDRDG
jgi:hypothetical protein